MTTLGVEVVSIGRCAVDQIVLWFVICVSVTYDITEGNAITILADKALLLLLSYIRIFFPPGIISQHRNSPPHPPFPA